MSDTSGIEASNLLKATKVLNVNPDWLQFECGNMRLNYLDFPLNACVPLLRYAQAINCMDKEKECISNVGLDGRLAKIASLNSFALVINDMSMAPTFMPDDIVIFDPTVKPCPGEFVVAKLKEEKEIAVFRKYRPLSHDSLEKFELVALSEDWSNILIHDKNQGEIIGTLIEHRCRRRIDESEDITKEF